MESESSLATIRGEALGSLLLRGGGAEDIRPQVVAGDLAVGGGFDSNATVSSHGALTVTPLPYKRLRYANRARQRLLASHDGYSVFNSGRIHDSKLASLMRYVKSIAHRMRVLEVIASLI